MLFLRYNSKDDSLPVEVEEDDCSEAPEDAPNDEEPLIERFEDEEEQESEEVLVVNNCDIILD